MLPLRNRLKKEKDFERLFKYGKGAKKNLFVLKAVENNLKVSRFATIVSQKVAKKATKRNKLKRQMREVLYSHLSSVQPGFDVAVIALKGAETKSFSEIKESLAALLKKAGLISKNEKKYY